MSFNKLADIDNINNYKNNNNNCIKNCLTNRVFNVLIKFSNKTIKYI